MSAKTTNTPADLFKEAKRLARQEEQIKRAKAALAKRMMAAARELGGTEPSEPPKRRYRRRRRKTGPAAPPQLPKHQAVYLPVGSGKTWTATMLKILVEADRPLTYAELREAVSKTHLAPKLEQTDRSFYGGIGKLESRKQAVRHKGRVFSSAVYERFQRDLKAGLVKDEAAPRVHGTQESPAKRALLAHLANHPAGLKPGEIVRELAEIPDLNVSDKNGKTAVYNLIARLANRGELVRENGIVRLPAKQNGVSHGSAMPASDNITGRRVGIEPAREFTLSPITKEPSA